MKQLVNRLGYYLKIYYLLVRFSVLDILIFRINALIIGLAPVVWLAAMIVFLMTIFSQIDQLGGWSFWEIVFLTGVHEVIFLLTWTTFGQNLRKFMDEVRTGEFDWILLKPISPRFLVSFRLFDFTAIGSFFNVVFVFAISFLKVMKGIHFFRMIGFLIFLFLAYWIAYFVYFIFASLVLFFINSKTFFDWIFDTTDFDRYPAEIYPSKLRAFLTFFLPILFFAYIPTAFFLGKLGWGYLPLGTVILFFLYLISHFIWHSGLRHYQSASS